MRLVQALVLFFTLPVTSMSQYVEQYREPAGKDISLTESIAIPAEEAGYTLILPDDTTAGGLIVFFNADRDTTNKLFRLAVSRNLGVMFVSTGNRLEFLFSDEPMLQIERYIHTVLTTHRLPESNLMYVGMSIAGTRSIKMALFGTSSSSHYRLIPRCIAVCDAPLDFVRFWHEMDAAKKLKATPITANEGEWVTGYLESNLHGTPATRLGTNLDYPPNSYTKADSAKLILLKNVLIRAYTEPDVKWWMKT
jgi:hypothetical protein